MRYQGQSFELEINKTRTGIVASFHRAHRARYGYAQEASAVEIVSARLRSIGIVEKLRQPRLRALRKNVLAKPGDYVETFFGAGKVRAAIYRRDELAAGEQLRSPCIVTEYSSTTLIPTGAHARVDQFGNLIIATE